MPEERVNPDDQASTSDQERQSGRDACGSRRLRAVTFGLGAAALAGVISVVGSATAPPGKITEATAQALTAADHDAAINQLIAGGGTGCLTCSQSGCDP